MNRFKTIIAGAVTAAMLLGTAMFVSAETAWECSIVPNFSDSRLEASGTSEAGAAITAMVLPQGKTPDDVWGLSSKTNKTATGNINGSNVSIDAISGNPAGIIIYTTQFKADSDGSFSLNIGISESGIYDVYFISGNPNEVHKYMNIEFVSSDDYDTAIDKLNDNIDNKVAFIALFEDSNILTSLGIGDSIAEPTDMAEILFDSQSGKELSYDYAKNLKLFNCCAAIASLNDITDENVCDYLIYAIEGDDDAMEWYLKYITTETAEKYLVDKMSGKNIGDTDELVTEFKSALLLYVVANPNGYENIKKIFEDFSDITGVSNPTSKLSVYSSIANVGEFDSVNDLMNTYNKLVGSDESAGGSSSTGRPSGGGGGGSSSGGTAGGSGIEVYGSGQGEMVEPMNKNIFDDLDSVPWAIDAIVELAARGVIAGKGDNRFCPDDMITREEFTKLVAEAFVSDIEGAVITFADVPADRWSYPYIAKAKAAGLINGYSVTEFGATDLISRQDMAVIIYNTALYKNVELADASEALTFSDDGEITDYAKESVYTLKAIGIVNGVSDMEFAPVRNATRAEAAVIIYALLQK